MVLNCYRRDPKGAEGVEGFLSRGKLGFCCEQKRIYVKSVVRPEDRRQNYKNLLRDMLNGGHAIEGLARQQKELAGREQQTAAKLRTPLMKNLF